MMVLEYHWGPRMVALMDFLWYITYILIQQTLPAYIL